MTDEPKCKDGGPHAWNVRLDGDPRVCDLCGVVALRRRDQPYETPTIMAESICITTSGTPEEAIMNAQNQRRLDRKPRVRVMTIRPDVFWGIVYRLSPERSRERGPVQYGPADALGYQQEWFLLSTPGGETRICAAADVDEGCARLEHS